MGQLLRLGQVRLSTLQLLGQQFLLGDIDRSAEKSLEDFGFNNWNSDAANVAYLAVGANNSFFYIATRAFRVHSFYGVSHKVSVVWMNGGQILFKCRGSLLRIQAVNLEQLLRPVIKKTGWVKCPTSHMGKALPLSEIKLVLLKRFLAAFAVSDVMDGTEHLVRSPGRVFFHIALTMHRSQFATGADDSVFYIRAQSSANGLLGHSEYKF